MPSPYRVKRKAPKRREKLRIEQLEARCVMDGAGFVPAPAFGSTVLLDSAVEADFAGIDGSHLLSIAPYNLQAVQPKPYQIDPNDDRAYIDAGTGVQSLDPLANDHLLSETALSPRIDSFAAPDYVGQITLSADGRRLLFEPAENYQGAFSLTYTVRYGDGEDDTVSGSFQVQVAPQFLAVENWFAVAAGSVEPTRLDVLANDPLLKPFAYARESHYRETNQEVALNVVGASQGSAGGSISISSDGKSVEYLPAEGFVGDETFTYTAEATGGSRQTATVTVHVAEPVADPAGVSRFASEGEFQQFVIDRAVAQYASQFGRYHSDYLAYPYLWNGSAQLSDIVLYDAAMTRVASTNSGLDRSETNVQVAGVDEADIVETDGRYLYTFSDGQLAIVDLVDPAAPRLVSLTEFDSQFNAMYLLGDRVTLLRTGSPYASAEVVVLDVSDRGAPSVVQRTEIDGVIADSRAIGDRIHLVVNRSFKLPPLERVLISEGAAAEPAGATQLLHPMQLVLTDAYFSPIYQGSPSVWRNETLEEYVDRVRDSIAQTTLPSFRTFGADGELVASGLLTDPSAVHKPLAGAKAIVSLVTLDVGDDAPGPVAPATSFVADTNTEVYVSADSAYLFSYDAVADETTIYKLTLAEDGSAPLAATGVVAGRLLNQFSADEHDGMLRVVTTATVTQKSMTGWGGWRMQTRQENNLLVLGQRGNRLGVVGEVTNLAPGETLKSVRFMGERAYVVTFRVTDPLFSIDLSDPVMPEVRGVLVIPGFSDYLHPVGEDYLIGIGRNATNVSGSGAPLQLTLFNVADLDHPFVVAQINLDHRMGSASEAWIDHHAVAYFAQSGVLAVPVSWTEKINSGGVWKMFNHSAVETFHVAFDDAGGATLEQTGAIVHDQATPTNSWVVKDAASAPRRAVRIGESLITVSNNAVYVHNLNSPDEQLGEIYIGRPAWNDSFTLVEDSGANPLDVLANDRPGADGQVLSIDSVTQPASGGVVAIAGDGRSLVFTPADDFTGQATFSYTVLDAVRGQQTASVSVYVQNTPDAPTAVDDAIRVAAGAGATVLQLRQNDVNVDPDFSGWGYFVDDSQYALGIATIDICYCGIYPALPVQQVSGLKITSVGPTSHDGRVSIDLSGRVVYTPAPGFEGVETFTYTVMNSSGLSSTATVTMTVGDPPADGPQFFLTPQRSRGCAAPVEAFAAVSEGPLRFMRLDEALGPEAFGHSKPVGGSTTQSQEAAEGPSVDQADDFRMAHDRAFASLGSDLTTFLPGSRGRSRL
ncbi:Beta propeller domain protein [Pirellulimonas nuda]|uniref:Beta propeller domain protein n=1 Tax=Pirellulimonas nuda TaxID=2528009 RepID=A0A518D9N5_9BACT|nr:beta-propeller domain-containing protein [Pirellulimonas nuda]QDU88199.1 Beta propeller domain protein [Pirellulimonas nuda]